MDLVWPFFVLSHEFGLIISGCFVQEDRSARPVSREASGSLGIKMCGMLAATRSFRARTVSLLQGPLAAVASAPRRVPARSRVPAN